jgi:hypothetical protein
LSVVFRKQDRTDCADIPGAGASGASLDPQIKRRLEKALVVVDDHGTRGTRLLDDADRFCRRLKKFIAAGIVGPETDSLPLELSCYALQLPLRSNMSVTPPGKFGGGGRSNLRERAESAAEMLVGLLSDMGHDALGEQTVAILNEVHQRHPSGELPMLLADALNLEDFGVIGLVNQIISISRQGAGVVQVAQGMEKREQYGYWEARLKESFHFEPIRAIAKKRLENARKVAGMLMNELREDGGVGV